MKKRTKNLLIGLSAFTGGLIFIIGASDLIREYIGKYSPFVLLGIGALVLIISGSFTRFVTRRP